ncbi:hypothetical protein JHK82_051152 [Glycine max]|nr:hypothetical protein JHK85_051859 [Glycine max]KAG5092374.1 hypothetical protein JHK82_051152 [Glycine max]
MSDDEREEKELDLSSAEEDPVAEVALRLVRLGKKVKEVLNDSLGFLGAYNG